VRVEAVVSIAFRTNDERDTQVVSIPVGTSLMAGAISQNVPGIEAACGGAQVCGTCHVYIDPPWSARLSAQNELEREMLECGVHVKQTSRLACQITIGPEHEGMVVTIPPAQR
jgi:2Fe-2S ferredoxin